MRTTRKFFALFAVRNFVAELIDNLDLDALRSNTRPSTIPFERLRRRNEEVRTTFGGTIAFAEDHIMRRSTLDHGARNGSTTANVELERFEIEIS